MKFTAASFAALASVASASIISATDIVERDASELCTYGTTGLQAQMAFVYPLVSQVYEAVRRITESYRTVRSLQVVAERQLR